MLIFLKKSTLPYQFRLDKKSYSNRSKSANIYKDLNNDGVSESINFSYFDNPFDKNYNIKVHNSAKEVVDQIDLNGITNFRWVLFEDYNNDNYKDMFTFSVLNDSIYLSIRNIIAKHYILDHQFILSKPDSAKKDIWDIEPRPIGLLNTDNDEIKELIFFVRGNQTIYPRTVYTYDIEEKKITNKFPTSTRLFLGDLYDINNDGEKEIIIIRTTVAGDIKVKTKYHDHTGWLFVLDKTLSPVFAPVNFGTFPGGNYVTF